MFKRDKEQQHKGQQEIEAMEVEVMPENVKEMSSGEDKEVEIEHWIYCNISFFKKKRKIYFKKKFKIECRQ